MTLNSVRLCIGLALLNISSLKFWWVDCFVNHQHHANRSNQKTLLVNIAALRWAPGDVEGDFERLENAIKRDQAEDDLRAQKRFEMMDFMASSRKEVSKTILILMRGPLLLSLLLSLIFKRIAGSRILTVINLLSKMQFLVCVVMTPLVFLAIQSRKCQYYVTFELPWELQGIGEHYLRFLTFYDDPKISCKDSVLCLLELWSFAVVPSLLFKPLSVPRRLLTRLSAVASLRQYPIQTYDLWYQQRYPLSGMVVAVRTFSKFMSSTPMFIIDVSILLSNLQPKTIIRSFAILFLFGTVSYLGFKHIKPWNKHFCLVSQFLSPLRPLSVSLVALWSISRYRQCITTRPIIVTFPTILRTILAIVSFVGTFWHLIVYVSSVHLAFTHNISLATCLDDSQDDCKSIFPFEDKASFQWRYWQSWREPERISQSLRNTNKRFWDWVLLEGSVDEQLSKVNHERYLPILARAKTDETFVFEDRLQWKIRAMNNVAEFHRKSIEDGTYLDPLGCAIYSTLGIGLGFGFDHMKPPANETKPSTKLLQARAAKSAQKRAVELLDLEGALNARDVIDDPILLKQRKMDMSFQIQTELNHMARRLTELVPTESSLTETDHEQSSSLYRSLLCMKEHSPSVQKLLSDHDRSNMQQLLTGRKKH